jgi:hypothetical protein
MDNNQFDPFNNTPVRFVLYEPDGSVVIDTESMHEASYTWIVRRSLGETLVLKAIDSMDNIKILS